MSWKDKPTILASINENSNYTFIDESGYISGIKKLNHKIVNHEEYNLRNDSIFLLNALFFEGKKHKSCLFYINDIKMNFFNSKAFNFHSSDIHNKKGIYYVFKDDAFFKKFGDDLTFYLKKTSFIQISTAINKVETIKINNDCGTELNDDDLFHYIYITHLIKISLMLDNINKYSILVFESVNKDLDKKILNLFLKLKKDGTRSFDRKIFKRIKAVYFVTKQTKSFSPYGEITDLTCRPVYNHFLNIEFHALTNKFYNYPNDEIKTSISILHGKIIRKSTTNF